MRNKIINVEVVAGTSTYDLKDRVNAILKLYSPKDIHQISYQNPGPAMYSAMICVIVDKPENV